MRRGIAIVTSKSLLQPIPGSSSSMPTNLKAWLFHSSSFCCCIPVRAGFLLMSVLTFLLSGAISVIIWFEISHSSELSPKERVAFILTGTVESLLFLASTFGFIGVVARKQLFVMIYAYFLYFHFVLNVIVGIYFLVTVRKSNRQQLVDSCSQVFVDTSMQSSCARLMSVSTYVFIAIVAALLLLELYGTLIAIRYVYRLRTQKRDGRSRRLGYFHAFSTPELLNSRHTRQASDNIELLHPQQSTGDPGFEESVLDIRRQNYMPLSTNDRDLPFTPPPPPLPPPSLPLSDSPPSRRVRALPPRPSISTAAIKSSGTPQEIATQPERLPNPHKFSSHLTSGTERPSPASEDSRHSAYTSDLSTNAHAAVMDHASYVQGVFSNPPPIPKYSQRPFR